LKADVIDAAIKIVDQAARLLDDMMCEELRDVKGTVLGRTCEVAISLVLDLKTRLEAEPRENACAIWQTGLPPFRKKNGNTSRAS
jgi:hypothetical protein